MRRLILLAAIAGFVLGWGRAPADAIPPEGGGLGTIPTIITPLPKPYCEYGTAICTQCNARGCAWACTGGYWCIMTDTWCSNGPTCNPKTSEPTPEPTPYP